MSCYYGKQILKATLKLDILMDIYLDFHAKLIKRVDVKLVTLCDDII